MNIAIIRPDGNVASSSFYNSQELGLARGLALLGVNTDVYIADSEKNISIELIDSEGSGRVRLIKQPRYILPEIGHAIYPKLINELKKNKYHLIQVNEENELTCFAVARYAYKQGIPVIVYQGMYKPIGGRIRELFQRTYNIFLRPRFKKYISLPVTKTERAKNYLISQGYPEPVVIPVGLDLSPFSNRKDRDWRAENSLTAGQPILLYVGILENRRNLHFLIDLAKKLKSQNVALLIAGGGPLESAILDRINTEKIDNVKLIGKVTQASLPSLYEAASLFLLASDYEIYGMAVLEAMYHGTPVISTPTAGPEDIIESGVDGVLIEGVNSDDWIEQITPILGDQKMQQLMRKAAVEKIEKHLIWPAVAKEYKRLVIDVLCQ